MIGVTHTGKIGDFGQCLPICSWLYKEYGEKIIFIFPKGFPFIQSIESLLRLQPFTEDIRYCDFTVNHYDMGSQPYKFNPNDYFNDLNLTKYYNFGFRSAPDKYIPEFYAEEYSLGVDYDFVLNLGLDFKYSNNKIKCSEVMGDFFPNFDQPDFSKDFLFNLQELAYAKERHLHSSSLALFLGLAKIPFYLYMLNVHKPLVDIFKYDGHILLEPKQTFMLFFRELPVLDVRTIEDSKIISVYDKIFFK
jgi:hypothetical protein